MTLQAANRHYTKLKTMKPVVEAFVGEQVSSLYSEPQAPSPMFFHYLCSGRRMGAVVKGRKVVRIFPVV
jgi:hypothetical protein